MKWFSLGSVTIPVSWVAIGAAFAITSIFLFITKRKAVGNWYGNVTFIFIMTWKLSVVIFSFNLVINNLINIIYFNGGMRGYWLGILAVILYTIFLKKRLNSFATVEFSGITLSWIWTVSVYELIIGISNQDMIWLVMCQFIINLVFLLLLISKKENRQWMLQIIILFPLLQGLVYSLKADLLSVPVATYGLLALFIAFLVKSRGVD